MNMSFTTTTTETFTITHARRLGSKIAADMLICQRYYGQPSEESARHYAEEIAQLLNHGYMSRFEFGYKKDEMRVIVWRYNVHADGTISEDTRPGKLVATADIAGASFYNYLWYSDAWYELSDDDRKQFRDDLPVSRVSGDAPGDGNGYWVAEGKSYSASGVGLSRQTFRPSS